MGSSWTTGQVDALMKRAKQSREKALNSSESNCKAVKVAEERAGATAKLGFASLEYVHTLLHPGRLTVMGETLIRAAAQALPTIFHRLLADSSLATLLQRQGSADSSSLRAMPACH